MGSDARWPVYLLVTITSGAGACLSVFLAVFSFDAVVIYLSVLTSIVCFVIASRLVCHRRDGAAVLVSLVTTPVFFCVGVLYFETRPIQTAIVQKISETGRFIAAKVKDPQPALDRAIREGLIRRATVEDARAFRNAYVEKNYIRKNLPVPIEETALSATEVDLSRAYVVLRNFTFPSGLVDEYRATFFIPAGVPQPTGNIGHSASYDFGTLTVGCSLARTGGISC